jgi:hypothetical protein
MAIRVNSARSDSALKRIATAHGVETALIYVNCQQVIERQPCIICYPYESGERMPRRTRQQYVSAGARGALPPFFNLSDECCIISAQTSMALSAHGVAHGVIDERTRRYG